MDTMRAAACEHEQQRDETDGSVRARIRQFGGQDELVDAMATGNIDITVGSNPRRRRLYQQTTVQVGGNSETATPQQQQQQQHEPRPVRPSELSWQTGKSTTTKTTKTRTTTKTMLTSTPIGTKEQPQTATPLDDDHDEALVSPVATCQLRGSSTEESRKIVSHKTITSTTTKSSSSATGSNSASRKSIALVAVNPPHSVDNSFTATQIRIGDNANVNVNVNVIADDDDDSDTEGVPASSLVIVSTPTRTITPTPTPTSTTTSPCTPHMLSGVGTFSKSLRQDYQTQAAQSSRGNEQEQEIQEFQSTMASINFARSNSQYDSHIKEKRGKLMAKKTKLFELLQMLLESKKKRYR